MINNLFLGAGEKRTVIGDCHNYVAKSLFPCSIRILNRFGKEQDRFDNVTSNFSFTLPSDDLYKIEVTNGIFAQDVKIYSGFCEVKNLNCFENTYNGFFSSDSILFEFNLLQITNNSKKSISCYGLSPTLDLSTNVYFTDAVNVGTPTATYYFKDSYNNVITDIPVSNSSIAVLPAPDLAFLLNSNIVTEALQPINIPVSRSVVFINPEATNAVKFNFSIKQ